MQMHLERHRPENGERGIFETQSSLDHSQDHKSQFSFSKHILRQAGKPVHQHFQTHQHSEAQQHSETFNNQKAHLYEKYSEIYDDLKAMKNEELIQLLLEELDQNQKQKNDLAGIQKKIHGLEQENIRGKQELKKKREALATLCETQLKNLQTIEKLEGKISRRNDYSRDTHYEKKYLELSMYMNEYIRNINTAQEEFQRAYSFLKSENARLEKQLQLNNAQCSRLFKKVQIQGQQQRGLRGQLTQAVEHVSSLEKNIGILHQQNQILRREIQVYQENIRITDRLEAHMSLQNQQLSSDLDFIRVKVAENQNISEDIIERLEESSAHCSKAKDQMFQSLNKQKERSQQLEKEIGVLLKKNELLQIELERSKQQTAELLREKEELEEDLGQEQSQKQAIKRELYNLADKVRLMESTYKKQLEQNQKIKDQLQKFWENKEKRESSIYSHSHSIEQPLGEIRSLNNKFTASESTIAYCESEVKIRIKGPAKDSDRNHNRSVIEDNQKQNFNNESVDSLA